MQIYAPVDSEPSAFHRAVFVFVSPHGGRAYCAGARHVIHHTTAMSATSSAFHRALFVLVSPHDGRGET